MSRQQGGFTVIELLVALVVGVLLLGSGYQLYITIIKDSADVQRQAKASNVAYDFVRQYQGRADKVKSSCAVSTDTPAMPSYAQLTGATATVTVTCPYSTTSASLVTATITYNDSNQKQQKVSRAITSKPAQ